MEGRAVPHSHTLCFKTTHLLLKMEVSLAYDSTKPWGDMLYEEEQNRKLALLRMPEPEWLACVNAYFNRLRGNGAALISALAWSQKVAGERAAFQSPKPVAMAMPVPEDERNWRVWKDMVEEPEKYGSDIGEWTLLDEEVRRGPKRWRVEAHWWGKVREIQEAEADAATRIQALWRGHAARSNRCAFCTAPGADFNGLCETCDAETQDFLAKQEAATRIQSLWRGHNLRYVMGPRFNCARCLKHGVGVCEWEDRCSWLCAECAVEWSAALRTLGEELEAEEMYCDVCEAGPDVCMGKVGDLWLCGVCIHDWTACDRCSHATQLGTRCDNHCVECGDDLAGLGGGHGGFCSADCRYTYLRDT